MEWLNSAVFLEIVIASFARAKALIRQPSRKMGEAGRSMVMSIIPALCMLRLLFKLSCFDGWADVTAVAAFVK